MNTRITFDVKDGKLVCPFQDEVEQVALDIEDRDKAMENDELHRNIYFNIIPLSDRYSVLWDEKYGGWVLREN